MYAREGHTFGGTVGVAESRDMRRWTILPPLEHDRMPEEMEVPQVYGIGGRYYLVFCTIAGHLGRGVLSTGSAERPAA